MSTMTGAELTIRLLENQGITILTGIPGGFNLPLYDALSRSDKIHHILARHEQGAGFIAQGLARTSGLPAVFFATSGPGATNALTAIADARLDSVPLICITGQVPCAMIGTDAFQEVDIYGMSIPVTKHNFLVRSVDELPRIIPEAFRIAMSGRPGPVLVDIPKDMQTAIIDLPSLPVPAVPDELLFPAPKLLFDAAAMIDGARKPVLFVGGGAANPRAAKAVRYLAENFGIPVTMSLQGLGILPADHPRYLGMLGMHGARYTNMLLEECDLLIVAGARFDDRATGFMEKFCPSADIIHIDIDVSEINKLRQCKLSIVSDAALALEGLISLLRAGDRSDWLARTKDIRARHPLQLPEEENPLSPYGIIRAVASLLDDSVIITTDVGQHQMRVAQAYPLCRTRQWLTSGGLGTMGFGLPAAIGAALGNPEATVVCFSGDGSFLMNIQELVTAVEARANVKVILCNNKALGLVHQQQTLFYGGRTFASSFAVHPDFISIAKGFGFGAVNLAQTDNPMLALKKALSCSGPYLIEVPMTADAMVFPMVPPGAGNNEMIGGE